MKALMLGPENPMRMVLTMILLFEVIVFGLTIPVLIMVTDLPPLSSALAGGGAAVLALIAMMTMRRPTLGYPLAWLAQVVGVAMGLLTSVMFALGGLFLALWVVSFVLGRRLESTNASR